MQNAEDMQNGVLCPCKDENDKAVNMIKKEEEEDIEIATVNIVGHGN